MANPKTLKQHIEEGRFIVYYQPQYLLSTRQICGAEALVRLTDGDKIVLPDEFVPALEEARIVDTLDFFVFDHICAMITKWKEEGRKVAPVSSNFSRHTMATEGFVNRLKEIVARNHTPKELIKLEITETAEAENRELFLRMVGKLKEEGFGIAIDDFGVMGANMRLLTEIEYDLLKIDKSVIDTVHTKKETKIMTGALIGACHHVGSKVLAEGVESDEQVQALIDAKCDAVQGYYFCKPVTETEFEKMIG